MNKRLCTCVALVLAVPGVACPQLDVERAPDQPRTSATARDRAEGLIKLDVVVTDADGKPVPGLDRADLSLLENGRAQKIVSFEAFDGRGAGTEPPVKIILLIDTVELPVDLARNERLAVESYLRHDGGRLAHPVSVFLLADTGLWTVTHESGDGNGLARQIERNDFRLVRGNVGAERGLVPAGLKDTASDSALKALGQIATGERTRPGRKLLLWVGPGWGIGSGAYAEATRGPASAFSAAPRAPAAERGSPPVFGAVWWFSALLREAHLVLYSFTVGETNPGGLLYRAYLDGVRVPHKASFMNVYRKVLAIQSGGRVMEEGLDLVKQIESCVQDAGYFYRISFDPFPADRTEEFHDLKVVVDRPGLTARTNTGYYDQPYYSVDPIPAPTRVSVGQLEQMLTSARGESDGELAKRISELALTERLSEPRLRSMEGKVGGKRARQELSILADASAFLEPPADEIPGEATPDPDAQRRILSLASVYLSTTIHKMPDLFARRTTVRYQETPLYLEAGTNVNYQPLHVTDSATTTVRYRDGVEVADAKSKRMKAGDSPQLITYGVFGPVLKGVQDAIGKSSGMTWSHWEAGAGGRIAVFRYVMPPDASLYESWLCCLPDGDGTEAFRRYVGYHEEIGIDPESGAILRLAFQADLKSTTPMDRSEIMIEYGPVEIGGKVYICPLRSVSIVRARSVRMLSDWDESFRAYGPYTTMLNDIRFDGYHVFRSESKMLTDYTATQK